MTKKKQAKSTKPKTRDPKPAKPASSSPKRGQFRSDTRPSATEKAEEESLRFEFGNGIFYNPAMRFCRSVSSLAVGAITASGAQSLRLIDAFCASGIRGIRYIKENLGVDSLTFIDIEDAAIKLAKKNVNTNKLPSSMVSYVAENISKSVFTNHGNFVEIDPFGTPSPYLVDAFRLLKGEKEAYLSVTATDVAVLCGGKLVACMKNYQARPMNSSITHEVGLRILMRRIVDLAAEFNYGAEFLISFSDRHYLKTIVHLQHGADRGFDSQKQIGHISLCRKCGYLESAQFPIKACPECKSNDRIDFAGPLWLGPLHNKRFIGDMIHLNTTRTYADKALIAKFLSILEGEAEFSKPPPFYYDIHTLCQLHQIQPVPKFDDVMDRLQKKGFTATRTHFSLVSIKTDAPFDVVLASICQNDRGMTSPGDD